MEESTNFKILEIETTTFLDQNPGTSGLRKKVTHFQQKHYLENFVQSIFLAHEESIYKGKSLVVGGDGRYFNDIAINVIIKIAAANGINRIYVADKGIMSTPCVSLQVRTINQENPNECFGAVILSASHNPGGITEDFGIKFNNSAGSPAPENITNKIFENTKKIKHYKIIDTDKFFDIQKDFDLQIEGAKVEIKIVSSTKLYVETMQKLFDFEKLRNLFSRNDFKFYFDALHGAAGPYAKAIFSEILGVKSDDLSNCDVLPDFGGHHPDPNLVYADKLVAKMDIFRKNLEGEVPDFGAACDGDADRNMILGKRFFISPSDSLAMIAANYKSIKNLNRENGLIGVARSMPTSAALDRVAAKLGIKCFEVPTGWKFFGNLMDAGLISICGEESFGTGSDHIREKDGLWAVLCWLSILADVNENNKEKLIGVEDIALKHWKEFGRNYYCRYDYENITIDQSKEVVSNIVGYFETFKKLNEANNAYIFEYHDSVDNSVSKNQGWIFSFADGSRIIFRVSGTSSTGATIRIYFEKYVNKDGNLTNEVLNEIQSGDNNLVEIALSLSQINKITGRDGPTVIT